MAERHPGERVLDIGCGRDKVPGAVGLDRVPLPGVDIVHDLNEIPYPLEDAGFDRVYAYQVIEHLDSVLRPMEEFHRLLKPGGVLHLETVHHTSQLSWQDPTHKWHLNTRSFLYFTPDYHTNYYTTARFRIVAQRVTLGRLWRLLGVEWLVNLGFRRRAFRAIPKFWESYLCYVARGRNMIFIMERL